MSVDRGGRGMKDCFVRVGGLPIVLNGSAVPIHDLNDRVGLALKRNEAIDYLFFFCTSTEADEGRFLIVDDVQDLTFRITPDQDWLDALAEMIQPAAFATDPTPAATADDAPFAVVATVLYGDTLFRARFHVHQRGLVEMLDDEQLMTQMPVMKDEQLKDFRLELASR